MMPRHFYKFKKNVNIIPTSEFESGSKIVLQLTGSRNNPFKGGRVVERKTKVLLNTKEVCCLTSID